MPRNQYQPDYAVPPGRILAEHLDVRDMSQAEFARRCGRTPKLISEIIAGKAPVEPNTALQFEKVLGLAAYIWLGIEQDYRLHLARLAETKELEKSIAWARKFPIAELRKRGILSKSSKTAELVSQILAFFGVASVPAYQKKFDKRQLAFRHSPAFKSSLEGLAAWIRLGELEAEQIDCGLYSEPRFREALFHIRQITAEPTTQSLIKVQRLCQESGVALVFVEGLKKAALSGAAWWLSPEKAVIQLSARYKTDDQFWFSLYHEAAHLLLHSRRGFYLDEKVGIGSIEEESEANKWAADFLISPNDWNSFVASAQFSESDIQDFSKVQGIAQGIVVGRLQHENVVPWNLSNELKGRLDWQISKSMDEVSSTLPPSLVFVD